MLCILAQDVYYIKPDNSSTAICPGQPCLTLGQLKNMEDHFITGSTFVFLAGNHSLQAELKFNNISDVTLRGPGRIYFGKNAIIACHSINNLLVEGITFVLCKYQCSFQSALEILTSGQVTISQNEFIGNANGTLSVVRSIYSERSNITVLNCHFEQNTGVTGGAMAAWNKTNITIAGSRFDGNRAKNAGGAISVFQSTMVLDGTPENYFVSNVASRDTGGAVECDTCELTLKGNNTFERNGFLEVGAVGGGALSALEGKLLFTSGYTLFLRNEAKEGGAITTSYNSSIKCDNEVMVVFDGNKAVAGGGLYLYESVIQTSKCYLLFMNNYAYSGGAGVIYQRFVEMIVDVSILSGKFINNSADTASALYIRDIKNITFKNTIFKNNSLYILDSNVTFENSEFSNSSQDFGGGVYSSDSLLLFKGQNLFDGNKATMGGAMHLLQVRVSFDGVTIFTHNSAETSGGALYAFRSVVKLYHTVNFTSNSAKNGGAVYLDGDAYMSLEINTLFHSSSNRALGYGGGIYHVDNADPFQCSEQQNSPGVLRCCIKIEEKTVQRSEWSRSKISSYNDFAEKDGNFLYGGLLDRCYVKSKNDVGNETTIQTMFKFLIDNKILIITVDDNEKQGISSQPYALCFCDGDNNDLDCGSSRSEAIYRGQKFTLPLIATAQVESISSTSVSAITSSNSSLALLQNPQHLPRHCSNLTYNLYSTVENEELVLYPEGPCHDTGLAKITINVTLLPCPDGFIQWSNGRCECEEILLDYNMSCIINEDFHFIKKAGSFFWMGAEYENGSYEGLILYKICPVEYCKTDEVNISSLHDLDVQCAQNRIGVLCGGCAENNSLLIGSSKCQKCSNTYLVLILPFAAAGIALVVFLSILRLTVATGMINSLILYANIVQVNRKLFFPANTVNVLTVFIAWFNLDLGFETCFYDGMKAVAQTCLQFAFPVYVWFLINLIILTSRYSITVSKLIGHNPIAVLATLLLMSYTKILKIIIEVYSSVKLDYPRKRTFTVWLKDANVPYLQSEHLALFVVTSLVFVFLFLPYTLLLLLGHKLYRFSGRKHLRWLNKLKPLLDSYHAPYKTHTRYWTGFLLLVRCALYMVFSFDSLGGRNYSLLAIIITFTAIGFAVGFLLPDRIYKVPSINTLEASIYLNLVTLSAVTLVSVHHKTAIVYFLSGIILATTVGVFMYHFHLLYTAKCKLFLKIKNKLRLLTSRLRGPRTEAETEPLIVNKGQSSHDPHKIISRTVINLREPLLDN